MKQCVNLIDEEYDGELRFSIIEHTIEPDRLEMILGAYDGDKIVGFKIEVPMMTRRVLFKNFQFILPAGTVKVSSIGEKSDLLIASLKKYYNPSYPVSGAFTDEPAEIDYKLRNQNGYTLDQDKIFLKFYYDEEQDDDLPKSSRIHLNMNFSFNLSRETASLIETREGYHTDLIAFLMK